MPAVFGLKNHRIENHGIESRGFENHRVTELQTAELRIGTSASCQWAKRAYGRGGSAVADAVACGFGGRLAARKLHGEALCAA